MSRIWNCITRGFRVRPPTTPSQTSSQLSDDNEANSEVDHLTLDKDIRRFVLQFDGSAAEQDSVVIKGNGKISKSALWTLKARQHDHEQRTHHQNYRVYFKIWDRFAYFTASGLLIGFMRKCMNKTGIVVEKPVENGTKERRKGSGKWNLSMDDMTFLKQNVTFRYILSKMPTVALPRSTVHAGGDRELRQTCNQNTTELLEQDVEKKSASVSTSEALGNHMGLSDEDLEEFISSAQDCIGKTYNVQGISHYKLGSYHEAVQCFDLGSKGGSSNAQFNLGLCYYLGKGTKKNLTKAMAQYRKAARQGHKMAQYNLALLLIDTKDVVKYTHAMLLLEQAAEQGLLQAQSLLGSCLAQEGVHQNMRKAVRMFQLAADQEDPLATYHLAQCHEHGLGGLEINPIKAFDLYATAANLGHMEAQYKMGCVLANGCEGIDKNEDLAMEIFKKAGEAGHAKSLKRHECLREAKQLQMASIEKDFLKPSLHTNQNISIDLSHLIIPELIQALNPQKAMTEDTFLSTPRLEDVLIPGSLVGGQFDQSVSFVNSFHRVSTWPSSLLNYTSIVSYPND
ncbi:uncharacterized protein LOC143461317 [Clavelina lepadiformis]|uniref:uncharacterized protein LOC143461317 n=1 Tax=Clavelina lepadiformis TaxID=159417 RepID=UPI004041EC01